MYRYVTGKRGARAAAKAGEKAEKYGVKAGDGGDSERLLGGAEQLLHSVEPELESALVSTLENLKCDLLVSSLCFHIQLVPLHVGAVGRAVGKGVGRHDPAVGGCTS